MHEGNMTAAITHTDSNSDAVLHQKQRIRNVSLRTKHRRSEQNVAPVPKAAIATIRLIERIRV